VPSVVRCDQLPKGHPMCSSPIPKNLLLARLPRADYDRLFDRMRPVNLDFKQVLYKYREPIDYVYFPTSGAASAVTVMEDGDAIEVATIGNEGVVGHGVLFANELSTTDVIIQVAGTGLRIDAHDLKEMAANGGPLRQLLLRYNSAVMAQISQSVACNGLHAIQPRCCRWLLITLDRMESNVVPLTHEFLAIMLGVRRSSVTEVLGPLQEKGLLVNSRGNITILDRKGLEKLACECYKKVKDEFDRLLG
jgi:CRP-like cAMP-binding protein